jgi:hypothetical protein
MHPLFSISVGRFFIFCVIFSLLCCFFSLLSDSFFTGVRKTVGVIGIGNRMRAGRSGVESRQERGIFLL